MINKATCQLIGLNNRSPCQPGQKKAAIKKNIFPSSVKFNIFKAVNSILFLGNSNRSTYADRDHNTQMPHVLISKY